MIADDQVQQLIAAARQACRNAYCPYSHFPVGAAILGGTGTVFTGCNVENASYGLTICAERNALFHAVAMCEKRVLAIVIYTPTQVPTAPCGACRQVLNEFGPDALVISVCDGPETLRGTVRELLPAAFGPKDLA
jgi:cytidine deaminase